MTTLARPIAVPPPLPTHQPAPGFRVVSVRGSAEHPIDPFLSVDEFWMSEPTFPPHPHAGFSAVTYLFEDSPGAFRNRDSLGDQSRIGPGAIHWTQAGRGMMHEEVPERPGTVCHGVQIFVNLRAADKHAAPRAFHADADAIPEVRPAPGARVRVVAGALDDVRSPLTGLLTQVHLLDVQLEAHARLDLAVPAAHVGFALVVAGHGELGEPARPIAVHQAATFGAGGGPLALAAGPRGLHVLVGSGVPIGEAVVFGGPFAMSTRAEVLEASARFQRGEMGRLAPSS